MQFENIYRHVLLQSYVLIKTNNKNTLGKSKAKHIKIFYQTTCLILLHRFSKHSLAKLGNNFPDAQHSLTGTVNFNRRETLQF